MVQPLCVHTFDNAMYVVLVFLIIMTLLLSIKPPIVFKAELEAAVRSKVKLSVTGDGAVKPSFLEQLSRNAVPHIAAPQRSIELLRNSFLSIRFYFFRCNTKPITTINLKKKGELKVNVARGGVEPPTSGL